MLVEIHVLQNLAPSNPNRDDVGAPKSAIFGGRTRGRISSQCIKRSIRKFKAFEDALAGHLGTRTKLFPELVRAELARSKIPSDKHELVVQACTRIAKAEGKSTGKKEKEKPDEQKRTPQLIYLAPGHAPEYVKKLEGLWSDDKWKVQRDYYLSQIAGFQELVEAALEDIELEDTVKDKIIENAWIIAELGKSHLIKFDWDTEEQTLPERTGKYPDAQEAQWIVERLVDLYTHDESKKKTHYNETLKKILNQDKEAKKNAKPKLSKSERKKYADFMDELKVPMNHSAVDIALFGRMTTSDAFEDVEACLEVAHAISTNEMAREVDYFTAVDDLGKGVAAAHIGENQFTSNCYYKYFSLDWEAFVTQLAGGKDATDKAKADAVELARTAVKELIRAAVCAIPTGKKKGHANNNLPEAVLVEVKTKHIPTSYANAFLKPVEPGDGDGDLMMGSIRKLGHYTGTLCSMYGLKPSRYWLHREGKPLVIVRQDGEKEPQKPETLADSQPDLDDLLKKVAEELAKEGV